MIAIKKGLEISVDDFWYDLFDGGYIKPEKLCKDKDDVEKVLNAVSILEDFKTSVENVYGEES